MFKLIKEAIMSLPKDKCEKAINFLYKKENVNQIIDLIDKHASGSDYNSDTDIIKPDMDKESNILTYFDDGATCYTEFYRKDGDSIFNGKHWQVKDGITIVEGQYRDDKKEGTWTYHTGSINIYKDGKLHGECINYEGDYKYIKNYHNGVLTKKQYHQKGAILIDITYEDDIEHFKGFYTNGKLMQKYTRINDKKEGRCLEWYDNGQVKEESYYKDGKLYGIKTRYWDNGNVKSIESYVDGKKHGFSQLYDTNNSLTRSLWDMNIKQILEIFDEDGNVKYKEDYTKTS